MSDNNFAWMIERKVHGYRPFQDGDWELYSCAGYGREEDAIKEIRKLRKNADEYTSYRAVKYTRHDPQRQRLVDALNEITRHMRDVVETHNNGDKNNWNGYYLPLFEKLAAQYQPLIDAVLKEVAE